MFNDFSTDGSTAQMGDLNNRNRAKKENISMNIRHILFAHSL